MEIKRHRHWKHVRHEVGMHGHLLQGLTRSPFSTAATWEDLLSLILPEVPIFSQCMSGCQDLSLPGISGWPYLAEQVAVDALFKVECQMHIIPSSW